MHDSHTGVGQFKVGDGSHLTSVVTPGRFGPAARMIDLALGLRLNVRGFDTISGLS